MMSFFKNSCVNKPINNFKTLFKFKSKNNKIRQIILRY